MATNGPYKRSLLYDHDYPGPPPPDRSTAPSPFRIDEGFSEETRSQTISEAAFDPEPIQIDSNDDVLPHTDSIRKWLLTQPVELRAGIARELLSSLPNSLLSEVVNEANCRLHFDPVQCLPQEIISNIFELLDPPALVHASLVSTLWRDSAFEPRLWRRLFGMEGWTHDRDKIRSFETRSRSQIQSLWSTRKVRPRTRDSTPEGSDLKRFRRDVPRHDPARDNSRLWVQNGSIGMPPAWRLPLFSSQNDKENDVEIANPDSRADEEMKDATDGPDMESDDNLQSLLIPESPVCPLIKPTHLLDTVSETPQPNWHYLYKQRRRLEQNWSTGRYTAFRLPHPDYTKEEAHEQCVYSLQFTATHLVSGSRDKTIRIWNLSTQRLKLPPLVGHYGSVLCLQFDERPQQDVIISGGSDSDVIIWRFSTGVILKRLRNAHTESVLNLRFDDRYLVTCSKDKTIKLWNRKDLSPTDPEYPQANRSPNAHYPNYIVNVANLATIPVVNPLPPYTLLMTLDQHKAAVNAIQIYKNEIVSASGDRKIMLWDIRTGTLIRTFLAHSKGIACVQYDGRRIISGSSDNSVRIFDSSTAAEVAVLDGHEDLVRTVQGDFGDLAEDTEFLEAEAKRNDKSVKDRKEEQLRTGEPAEMGDDHFVYGAKLPPNGGGNRWSKIVSGSYDETVIIWRKDENGKWFPAKQLRQEDAMRATAPPGEFQQLIPTESFEASTRSGFVRVSSGPPFSLTSLPTHIFQQAQALGMPPNLSILEGLRWMQRHLLLSRTAWGYIQFFRLRFWNLPGIASSQVIPPDQDSTASSQTPVATSTTAQDVPLQTPSIAITNTQPHPHYQYQQILPSDAPRQMPPIPRVNAQLRQPHLQAQFHNRLAQHLFQSCRDVNLPPGPANDPSPQFQQQQPNGGQSNTQTAPASISPPPSSSTQPHNTPHPPPPTWHPHRGIIQYPQPAPPQSHTSTAAQNQTQNPNQNQTQTQTQNQTQNQPQPQNQNQNQNQPQTQPQTQNQPQQQQQNQQQQQQQEGGLSRVFKLQFDSRRIICCSQQPIIVGWDFANGDEDIEEASQFFDAARS